MGINSSNEVYWRRFFIGPASKLSFQIGEIRVWHPFHMAPKTIPGFSEIVPIPQSKKDKLGIDFVKTNLFQLGRSFQLKNLTSILYPNQWKSQKVKKSRSTTKRRIGHFRSQICQAKIIPGFYSESIIFSQWKIKTNAQDGAKITS